MSSIISGCMDSEKSLCLIILDGTFQEKIPG